MRKNLLELCGFDNTVQALTRIYSGASNTTERLGNWLSSVEFETLPSGITCMTAAAAASIDYEGVPNAVVPRLRGIVKYVHTLNAGMMAGLCRMGTAFNEAKLPLLLLEETALYMQFPNLPQRHLWQMRVGVRQEEYTKALEVARHAGFQVEVYPFTAMAKQGNTCRIIIMPLKDGALVWQGCFEFQKVNAVFRCASNAAVLMGICQNAFRSLTKPSPCETMVRWIMDMSNLYPQLSAEDWDCAVKLAKQENAQKQVCLLLTLYATVTNTNLDWIKEFGDSNDNQQLIGLLHRFQSHSAKGHKIRRSMLLCRLRRPDSVIAAAKLFMHQCFKKLKH